MDLDVKQLALQLGIAGLLIAVGYRIALVLIKNWRETEKERTAALERGFGTITTSMNNHSAADIASHERLAESHADVREAVVRVEAKLDTIAELTPVKGIPRPALYGTRGKTGG